jgi:hypothetical protein
MEFNTKPSPSIAILLIISNKIYKIFVIRFLEVMHLHAIYMSQNAIYTSQNVIYRRKSPYGMKFFLFQKNITFAVQFTSI